ncbi:MAG: LysR family transcriptional regulator [Eubacteriales bacterium]
MEPIELNKLYYFYIVAKHEHVTRAAEELCIAQPALTKTVKLLEEEFGVPLFYKKGRNIALTPFGEHLRERLDVVFPILREIPNELEAMKGQAKSTIKLNVLAASTVVTSAIVEYKKQNAQTVFQLIQNEEEMDCDLSVTTNAVDFARLPPFERRCIMEEKIYLAVPKDSEYARCSSIDLSAVKDEGFVNLAGSRLFRVVCDKFCASAGFRAKSIFESDSPAAVRNIIGAGAGVGFWPAFSWGPAASFGIRLLPIRAPVCQRELIVGLHAVPSLSEIAADFYEYLLKFLQERQMEVETGVGG